MCNAGFNSSDWGMEGYYRQMEIADAEAMAEEARRDVMWNNFLEYRANIMAQIQLNAAEYKRESIDCSQEDYLENNEAWLCFLKDCLPEMDFGLGGWKDEEAREALLYLLNNEDKYFHCSKINQFAEVAEGV